MKNKIIKLSSGVDGKSIRFLSRCKVELAEGKTTSTVTVTRTGTFSDPRYGRFEISRDMLLSMVKNFKAGAYGQDIFLDVDHKPGNGAAAKIINLSVEGNRLRAEVEWTPYGIEAVRDKGYQYLSAEYAENYIDNEAGQQHGPVLLGAALTVRPVVKHLDPVRLSEASDHPLLIHPELLVQLYSARSCLRNLWSSHFIREQGA
jgi:phage I-like protein